MRFLFLMLIPLCSIGQGKDAFLSRVTANKKIGSQLMANQQKMFMTTFGHASGSNNLLIREPDNVFVPPIGGWPVVLFYMGDGTDVTTTTVTGQSLSSGDTFTWTATGSNAGSNRILSSSVVIYDDGVIIARGQIGGTITGTNITSGSVGLTNSSSAFTFTSSVALAGSILVNYVYSATLLEGPPLVFNQGDTDERFIFVGVQNDGNDIDYTIAKHFDPVIKYLYTNYTINPNRIGVTGISRGARFITRPSGGTLGLIESRANFWIKQSDGTVSATDLGAGYTASGIASLTVAATDIGGSYTVFTDMGQVLVQGTNDLTLTNNLINHATTFGNQTLNEYPYTQSYWNIGHTATIWHNNYAYRLWRTDATGVAEWDWIDFQMKYSRDAEECATLFVEQAERRRWGTEKDIIDYREAVRKVTALSAGAVKTALQARLTTLKTTLDGLISWRSIIVHTNGTYPISLTGYNEINNHADFQSTGTLVDDNGNTLTGISWAVGDNPLSSNYQTEITSNRGRSSVGGFPFDINRVGMRVSTTVCPVGYTGLPSGTYTYRIYFNEGSGSYTQKEFTATIGGVTKTQFAQINRLIGYVEWTGLSASDLSSFNLQSNVADVYVTVEELIKN